MARTKPKPFVLWKPTLWDYICKFILSESFAWGFQNALGVLFTILFVVVDQMTFTLACITSALYGASAQVLSLDRSIGGRLFGGTIFVGCILSGGVAGFAVVSLSWLARGDGVEGILEYLPSSLQQIPSRLTIGELKVAEGYLQSYLTNPPAQLPAFVSEYLGSVQNLVPVNVTLPSPSLTLEGIEDMIRYAESRVPSVSTAYWALLIVLYFVMSFPFAFSRGLVKSYFGLVLAIATLFMGSQVVFGSLMPILGQRLFWTQVTGGYLKVGLVNVAAMVITGTFFFVRSAHDTVRTEIGNVLLSCGRSLSQIASDVNAAALSQDAPIPATGKNDSMEKEGFEQVKDRVMKHVEVAAFESAKTWHNTMGLKQIVRNLVMRNEESATGKAVHEVNQSKPAIRIQADTYDAESALTTCLFEPPIPGCCSHFGAKRHLYENVLKASRQVIGVIGCLETSFTNGTYESRQLMKQNEFNDALNAALGSSAAVLAQAAYVLQDMPLGKLCYGPSLKWRPKGPPFYSIIEIQINRVYDGIVQASGVDVSSKGVVEDDSGLPGELIKGHNALLTLTTCNSLLKEVQDLEWALCKALEISTGYEPKETLDLKTKIMRDPFAPSIIMHVCLLSSLLVWGLMIQGIKLTISYCSGSLSKLSWRKKREVHFALKYWLGLTIAITGILLIMWLGKGDDSNPVQGYANAATFFFNWQPVYFSITAAICIQMEVESSALKAVLRSTMTFLGGLFGYLTMLNGSLAQNPYFITSIACAFNAVCGFLSPVKELRYSLFLASFTFNAVVICQYFGCCNLEGTAVNFGGKVVSTMLGSLYAMLISWCVLPYYTSDAMLTTESSSMDQALELINDMFDSHMGVIRSSQNGGKKRSHIDSQKIREWDLKIENELYPKLTEVIKAYKMNTIDKKQFLFLTYTLLPTPPVVPMVLEKLANIVSFLKQSINVLSDEGSLNARDIPEDSLVSVLDHCGEDMTALLSAARETTNACTQSMSATSKSELKQARVVLKEASEKLGTARAKIFLSLTRWFETHQIDISTSNVRVASSVHLLLLSLKEMQIIACILSDVEESLERDFYFSWLSSWYGRRPVA